MNLIFTFYLRVLGEREGEGGESNLFRIYPTNKKLVLKLVYQAKGVVK